MDDEELLEIASRLEFASDNDAAQSQLSPAKPWFWLTGNRDALLRFAAAFIRAAATPIPDDDCRAEPVILDHDQIPDGKADYALGALQRIDRFPENPELVAEQERIAYKNDRMALLSCAVVTLVVGSLILAGLSYFWHQITGTPLP